MPKGSCVSGDFKTQYWVREHLDSRAIAEYNRRCRTNLGVDVWLRSAPYFPWYTGSDFEHMWGMGLGMYLYAVTWTEAMLRHEGMAVPASLQQKLDDVLVQTKNQRKGLSIAITDRPPRAVVRPGDSLSLRIVLDTATVRKDSVIVNLCLFLKGKVFVLGALAFGPAAKTAATVTIDCGYRIPDSQTVKYYNSGFLPKINTAIADSAVLQLGSGATTTDIFDGFALSSYFTIVPRGAAVIAPPRGVTGPTVAAPSSRAARFTLCDCRGRVLARGAGALGRPLGNGVYFGTMGRSHTTYIAAAGN
jgi:hypothetical protein